ncbi:MAG: VanZ family protein [Clostridia bacterium]|nr:VanZ family protein [Clostridia bacterium]
MSYSVFTEVLFLLVLGVFFLWLNTKEKASAKYKKIKFLWLAMFLVYAAILLWAAIGSRSEGYEHSLNLRPLYSYFFVVKVYNSFDVFKQILDNILVFIPFGMLLPASFNMKHKQKNYALIVLAGFAFSLFIEAVQYLFSIGFTEVDDLINNVWGCLVGCGIYALTDKIGVQGSDVILKKGWQKCLYPLISVLLIIGAIWCYRELWLCRM